MRKAVTWACFIAPLQNSAIGPGNAINLGGTDGRSIINEGGQILGMRGDFTPRFRYDVMHENALIFAHCPGLRNLSERSVVNGYGTAD